MRRKRCPHCNSLKTAVVIIGKKDKDDNDKLKFVEEKRVCDNCDTMFNYDGTVIKEE